MRAVFVPVAKMRFSAECWWAAVGSWIGPAGLSGSEVKGGAVFGRFGRVMRGGRLFWLVADDTQIML